MAKKSGYTDPVNFPGKISITAPSSGFDKKLFKKGIRILEKNGLCSSIDEKIFHTKSFLAGKDETRAQILLNAFSDPNTDIVWAARGGYGAIRLLEYLEKNIHIFIKNRKFFVGFSDISIIHSFLIEKAGFITVHGPNITSVGNLSPEMLEHMLKLLKLCKDNFRIKTPGMKTVQKGKTKGVVKGGNLSSLCSLVGTPWQADFKDCILFLEEIGEQPYRIDRMLTQMRLSGCFENIKGLILGDFSFLSKKSGKKANVYSSLITNSLKLSHKIPVIKGFPAGHGKNNFAFFLGAEAVLDADKTSLTYEKM